jgi:hypothetical protein
MDHGGGLLADGLRDRLRPDLRVHLVAAEAEFWASPDFSRTSMPPGFPDVLRSVAGPASPPCTRGGSRMR